jgi:hypothetical protein
MKELEALQIAEDMMFESITNILQNQGRDGVDDTKVIALSVIKRMIETKERITQKAKFRANYPQNKS